VSEAKVKLGFQLPPALVTRADLSRLVRDIETIDNELEAQKARNHATGSTGYHLPSMTKGINDFAELNNIDLADDQTRMLLKDQMKMLKEHAPVLHMTFAVEADADSLQKIVDFVRKEIHPQALLSIGLQPSLVGGVYLRTPNHVHDLSVRGRLKAASAVIAQDIEQMTNIIEVKEAPPEEPEEYTPEQEAAVQQTAAIPAAPATPAPAVAPAKEEKAA
jgi:hypothetical protein